MATTINRLEAQDLRKLPSQTMVNPRKNVSAILLRSDKEVEISRATLISLEQEKEKDVLEEKSDPNDNSVPKRKFPALSDYKPVPPFPQVLVGYRKDEQDHELYDTFGRCEINISLIDAIKQIPPYDKFLKHLCKSKRKQKLKGCEKVNIRENVFVIIQRKIPTKCTDLVMFTILRTIGDTNFEKAMIDSGASINIMSYSIYASLKLGSLNETGVAIQLANKSNAYPKVLVEDILWHAYHDKISEFNIYDAMKHPDETSLVYFIKVIDHLDQKILEHDKNNAVKVVIDKHIEENPHASDKT
ncbi:uncharacterized protein LOC111386709 [Olea europaea var. sylvestris]|uniref:uncharacterized protein LOC111386709 n=1 Tax=Olea europaea var. sylvestris TaxID=158386 RepID=UPI000C1D707C|nr:uncharacterized protein LOC111386709 [Olea europaea var. sylvestris]